MDRVRKNLRISKESDTMLQLEAVYSRKNQEDIVDFLIKTHCNKNKIRE